MADYIKASDLALLTEGYELTMADGFMGAGMKDTVAYLIYSSGAFPITAVLLSRQAYQRLSIILNICIFARKI